MKQIVQIGWSEANNFMPLVLICKTEREALGITLPQNNAPATLPADSIVKISTNRGGMISSRLALVNLQFRQHIGPDKVTVNDKVADALDLCIGSEVTVEKATKEEVKAFIQEIQESIARGR